MFLGCGEDGTSEPQTNPLPVLTGAVPAQLVAGSGATTMTLTGSGFVSRSQVRWNDADRVTHYQSAQTLTVDLLASDLASFSTGRLTVVNGPPGGGTSGVISVPIGYPAPVIAAVTPNSSPVQSSTGSLPITITGSGFVQQSSLRFGTDFVSPSSITATQILASIPYSVLRTPGVKPLSVVNPSPGGGASNAVTFSVTYPIPTIAAFTPDSSFTGSAFALTVVGSGFGPGSVVRWNGADRPTTFGSSTQITAAIPASDAAAPTLASVTVFNPTPGGGTSNAVSYRIREPAPVVSGLSPAVITAGSSTTPVTLTGSNFRTGATVQWNGQNRISSLVSSTTMTVTLTSNDLALAGVGRFTITNPGASGVSNSISLAVVAAGAGLSVARTITLSNADLVYDNLRAVLYASVPASAPENANSIVRIDPGTGSITGAVSVGSNPGTLAITDDNQFLYVGLLGAPTIVRVALATFSKDIEIILPGGGLGSAYAEDILPIPGSPQTIAVSTFYPGFSPRNAGTLLFDNAARRPSAAPEHTGSNRITRGPTATRIYGYNNETTEFGFRSLVIATDGLRQEFVKGGLVSGFGANIEYDGGFVYATTGEVVDPSALQKLGTIPSTGVVRPDATNARVHFLNGPTIRTYHHIAFTSIGVFSDAVVDGHTKLVRWGTDGLAIGGGTSIVLVRGGLVAP
jgi:hypothetical protein